MSRHESEPPIEQLLSELREHVRFPPTPPLVTGVRRRLATNVEVEPRIGLRWGRRWPALAALLVVCLLLAASWPAAREAAADRLGLPGAVLRYVPDRPSPTPQDPRRLLGARVSLAIAQSAAHCPVRIPTDNSWGDPDEVYLNSSLPGEEVTLLYRARPGFPPAPGTDVALLVSQAPGRSVSPTYGKELGPDTRLRQVQVGDRRGFWLDGAPHRFQYLGPDRQQRVGQARLADHVLLWELDGCILRLESGLTLEQVLPIAVSLR